MANTFTDWEGVLMHYGVPGMKKGVRHDEQYKKTKQRIEEAQSRNARNAAMSPTGKGLPSIRNPEIGTYEKDKSFMKKKGIPSAYPTAHKRVTTKKPDPNAPLNYAKKHNNPLDPQSIINKNRKKSLLR